MISEQPLASKSEDIRALADGEFAAWDAAAARSPADEMHQCTWWASPLRRYGVDMQVIASFERSELVGGAMLRAFPLPLSRFCLMECLEGPVRIVDLCDVPG